MVLNVLTSLVIDCSVYSGTVAGAREAFFNGVPSISISYDWYVLVWLFLQQALSRVIYLILATTFYCMLFLGLPRPPSTLKKFIVFTSVYFDQLNPQLIFCVLIHH